MRLSYYLLTTLLLGCVTTSSEPAEENTSEAGDSGETDGSEADSDETGTSSSGTSGDDDSGMGTGGSSDPSAICTEYIACLEELGNPLAEETNQLFGPQGACWMEESRFACEQACQSALTQLVTALEAGGQVVPVACGGVGGSEGDPTTCNDGVDNDADGFTDCDDFDCMNTCDPGTGEDNDAACSDGIDNDGNGLTDCLDFNCSDGPLVTVCDGPEDNQTSCSDGFDNDDDGYIDCDDFDCRDNPNVDCVLENTNELCSDDIDNDDDGFTDCDDFDCGDANVTVCP
jgi:hypothetical protein